MKPIEQTLDTQRANRLRCSRLRHACRMRTSSPPSKSAGTGTSASPSDGRSAAPVTGEDGAVVARDGKPEREYGERLG